MNLRHFTLAALLAGSASAHASTIIFADNFDADRTTNNATSFLQGWQVSQGTVDLDGVGFVHNELPGHGHYVDLDGSTNHAGILSKSLQLSAGVHYTLNFDLAGNQRNWPSDTVDVSFAGTQQTYVLASGAPLSTYSLSYTPTTSATYTLSFHNRGGDNRGAFLDNVSVSAVPEPSTYAMLLAGLAGLVTLRRRRS